jgi:type IV pilus assembly protein PilA
VIESGEAIALSSRSARSGVHRVRLLGLISSDFVLMEIGLIALVVVALASILILNGTKLAESSARPASATELHDVQIAVTAAMAAENTTAFTGGTLDGSHNLYIGNVAVGDYIKGGNSVLSGSYRVEPDGSVESIVAP